jgi:hypothetical protein
LAGDGLAVPEGFFEGAAAVASFTEEENVEAEDGAVFLEEEE